MTNRPVALTIAGSDSGGGAGVQADLKTFASVGVHGTSAITCITAQNPNQVRSIQAVDPSVLRDQIESVFDELQPTAVKTGMLYSAELIEVVANALHDRHCPLVIDPVMVSTSGSRLLEPDAIQSLRERLFPLATLITPNLHEAALLLHRDEAITNLEQMKTAGAQLSAKNDQAFLIKGGHLDDGADATDVLIDGDEDLLLRAPRVEVESTHGTGCTYSAAISAYLALGCSLSEAVRMGKVFISESISQHYQAGGHSHLNHFWEE